MNVTVRYGDDMLIYSGVAGGWGGGGAVLYTVTSCYTQGLAVIPNY